MNVLRTIFCLFFTFASMLWYSQGISLTTDSTIVSANGEIRGLMLQIVNKTGISQNLRLTGQAPDGIRFLNADTKVKIEAGEKLFVPFKIFIEKSQPAGSSVILLNLWDSSNKKAASWQTILTVESKRLLRITADDPQMLIYRVGDSLKISTQVTNGGNQPEEAEIFATFPQYLGSEVVLKKKVTLLPFTSQKVVFSKIIDRDLLRMEIFTVNVAGINSNKEFFGNATVTVQNALGSRRYIDPQQNNFYRGSNENHISWSTSNPFEKYSASHNIDLRSEINLGNTKATLNLNGTYWSNLNTPMMFQNTWLKVEHKNVGVQLGNLLGSDLEITLNGRGAQFFYTPQEAGKMTVTAGAVEKTYNVFDPIRLHHLPRGYSAFAQTNYSLNEHQIIDAELILDTDLFQKSYIVKSGFTFNNRKDVAYDIDLGYGHTRSASDVGNTEPSVFLGFNYRKNWEKYAFSSTNYYSSGYYPGIRRGSTVTEQRLNRVFEKFSLYGAYSFNRYDPKNIEPLYQFNSFTERHRAEIGSSFNVSKRVSANVISQASTERSDVILADYFSRLQVRFNSATVAATLNYSLADNNNRFTFTHAQGISSYLAITEPHHIYSFQANWQHRNLTVSSIYQHGNFLLYEGSRNGSISDDTEKFSAVLSYRLMLLNSKLSMNFTALANLDSQTGNSLAFNANGDYRLFRATKIFASINYNKYSRAGFGSATTYYQIGVSQDLPKIGDETVSYKNGTVKIFTFMDLNNNNIYEPGIDQPARGVKVKINNTVFISGEDGNIRYRKLPYGEYLIQPNENEWYGEERKINLQQKEVFITLALEKTGILKGKVKYEKTSKFQYAVQEYLAGITVVFRSSTGKTFTFYTNAQGQYTAYIPLGEYHISLDNQNLQKNVYTETGINAVTVENSTPKNLEDIVLKVREKKLDVKKFGNAE